MNAIQHLMGIHRTKTRTGQGGKGEGLAACAPCWPGAGPQAGVIAAGSPGVGAMLPVPAQAKHRTPPVPPHPSHTTGSPCAQPGLTLFHGDNQSKGKAGEGDGVGGGGTYVCAAQILD